MGKARELVIDVLVHKGLSKRGAARAKVLIFRDVKNLQFELLILLQQF